MKVLIALCAGLAVFAVLSAQVGTIPGPSLAGNTFSGTQTAPAFSVGAAGWQLASQAGNPTYALFSPTAANTKGDLWIAPSGSATIGALTLSNSSDPANFSSLAAIVNGATALFGTATGGTGTPVTLLQIGERTGTSSLANINYTFGGATVFSMTPTFFTAPNLQLSSFSAGAKQVVCMNNGVIYAGNNTGIGPPCP